MPRRGFTLLELVVVIAILGLLLSILAPAVQSSREAARRAHCMSNLRQIGLALHSYEAQHRSFPCGNTESGSFLAAILPESEQAGVHAMAEGFRRDGVKPRVVINWLGFYNVPL